MRTVAPRPAHPGRLRGLPSALLALLAALLAAGGRGVSGDGPAAVAPGAAGAPGAPADDLARVDPWLRHADWTVRSIAAFALRRRTDDGVVERAAQALDTEQDPRVLGCLLAALEGRPRVDLVAEGGTLLAGRLVTLLEHPHPVLRARALALLARLPTLALGERPDLLAGWWERARDALAREQAVLRAARRERPASEAPPAAPGESRTVARAEPDLLPWVEGLKRDGLELMIVLDATGSMGPVIAAAKAQCEALVRRLTRLAPPFRAGLVTYDDGARLRVPLTVDAAELRKGLEKVAAAGGGDVEEGVDKGILLALQQGQSGWSRRAQRVIVVVGDAPPHDPDVVPLLKRLAAGAQDDLFDHPVTVHCVSTAPEGVEHFGAIAAAGRGVHLTLGRLDHLGEELLLLTFGRTHRALAEAWLAEIDRLEAAGG